MTAHERATEAARLLNRELSWLEWNARVLDLAEDPDEPLLERVKFCAIFSSNLDEFFQVRVAGLLDQVVSHVGNANLQGVGHAGAIHLHEDAILEVDLRAQVEEPGKVIVQAALPNDESMECATKVSMGEAASVDHRNDPRLVLLGRRRPRYGCGITSYLDDCSHGRAAPGTWSDVCVEPEGKSTLSNGLRRMTSGDGLAARAMP